MKIFDLSTLTGCLTRRGKLGKTHVDSLRLYDEPYTWGCATVRIIGSFFLISFIALMEPLSARTRWPWNKRFIFPGPTWILQHVRDNTTVWGNFFLL